MSSDFIKKVYFASRPKTFSSLQRFVQSCAKANAAYGKKPILGKDKYPPAVENMRIRFAELCDSIDQDGDRFDVDLDNSWSQFKQNRDYYWYVDRMIGQFKQVFPSWPDAYAYWDKFYAHTKSHNESSGLE